MASPPALRAGAGREARLEELLEPVRSAERVRHADVAGDDRPDREHDQRERHRRRRVVQMTRAARAVGRAPVPVPGAACSGAAVLGAECAAAARSP